MLLSGALVVISWGLPAQRRVVPQVILRGQEQEFAEASAVIELDDGRFAVLYPDEALVRVFSREGVLKREWGGAGAGPGEFRQLSGSGTQVGWLWIHDRATARLTRLNLSTGEMLLDRAPTRMEPHDMVRPGEESLALIKILGWPQDDVLLIETASTDGDPAARRTALVWADLRGVVHEVAVTVPSNHCRRAVMVDGLPGSVRLPLCEEPLIAASPDGRVIAVLRVEFGASPRLCLTVARFRHAPTNRCAAVQATTVDPSELRTAMKELEERAPHPAIAQAVRRFERLPEYKPLLRRALVGNAGEVWVQAWGESSQERWHQVRTDGTLSLPYLLPVGTSLFAIGSQSHYAVRNTMEGYQDIVRLVFVLDP